MSSVSLLGDEKRLVFCFPMRGDGVVVFVDPKGDEVKGRSAEREGRLVPAWRAAKAEIDARTMTTAH